MDDKVMDMNDPGVLTMMIHHEVKKLCEVLKLTCMSLSRQPLYTLRHFHAILVIIN